MKISWLRFWADTFTLFKNTHQPYARAICVMILPCHEDWWWQYRHDHNPANDNRRAS